MQKILMFDAAYPPPVVGGKEKQAHLLAKELDKLGVIVDAITLDNHNDLNKNYEHDNINVRKVKDNNLIKILFLPFLLLWYKIKNKHKIIHIHTPSWIGIYVLSISKMLFYKTVFKFPNEKLVKKVNSKKNIDKIWFFAVKSSDKIVVLENNSFKALKKHYPSSQIFRTPNGVKLREKVSFKNNKLDNEIKLLFIGRLVKHKGCKELVEALKLLEEVDQNYKMTIVGSGPFKEKMKTYINRFNLENNVKLEGYQDNVIKYIKQSDVLLLPSYNEGMPNVILEAMSCGLPVIATKTGSNSFLLGEYASKFLIEKKNPEDLFNKIIDLFSDKNTQEEYSLYLHNRCKNIFDINIIAKNYMIEYQELIK